MKKKILVSLVLVGSIAFAALALATDTVIINGSTYMCQSTCNVTYQNGSWYVTDAFGGWVAKLLKTGKPI